jgi:hypothetical protein
MIWVAYAGSVISPLFCKLIAMVNESLSLKLSNGRLSSLKIKKLIFFGKNLNLKTFLFINFHKNINKHKYSWTLFSIKREFIAKIFKFILIFLFKY